MGSGMRLWSCLALVVNIAVGLFHDTHILSILSLRIYAMNIAHLSFLEDSSWLSTTPFVLTVYRTQKPLGATGCFDNNRDSVISGMEAFRCR